VIRALCACVMLAGCAEQLTPQSLVSDLRVLAIRAEPAEAAPGETVRLEALVVDPFGQGRSIERVWASCPDPPGDSPVRCVERGSPDLLGSDERVEVTMPADLPDGRSLGVLLYVCAGGTVGLTEDGPTCTGEGASGLLAVRRVKSAATSPNRNPTIAALALDGAALEGDDIPEVAACADDCASHALTVSTAEDAAEPVDGDGGRTEELVTSWLATSGAMERPFGFGSAPAVEWTPPDGTGLVFFWVVLRDDRGGVDWIERQALVR